MKATDEEIKKKFISYQKNEITEYHIYAKLAKSMENQENKKIILRISRDELRHYNFLKRYTGVDVAPEKLRIWWYLLITKILGITFGIKLMENGEESAQKIYRQFAEAIPELSGLMEIAREEDEHENALIRMINEERLEYVGSIVLGLNDALVELTGALAGFTFALQNSRLIAAVGLITGIAASLSMAASEYLSTKTESAGRNPVKAAFYTGFAYIITVLILILPFLLLPNVFYSLGAAVLSALIIIMSFTFYISVVRETPFSKRFLEMAAISLGIAALSFSIGYMVKEFIGI
jgi:VIT1/CCC1 family predicted Fe2+/Mn2+ transporter